MLMLCYSDPKGIHWRRKRELMKTLLILVLLTTSVTVPSWSQDWERRERMNEMPRRTYIAYQAETPVVIDGKLDDAVWDDAPWSEEFGDIEGAFKPRPRFATRAKMLWDDEYFYIAARMQEPHVWGTLTKRDSVIFYDNDFEIFIDPDGDTHQYYELEINALNTVWDLFLHKPYKNGGPADNEWNIDGLKHAVDVQGTLNDYTDIDRGWTVEFAIPWEGFDYQDSTPQRPQPGDQWRINFSRVEWEHVIEDRRYTKVPGKREDNWVWSPQGIIDMHRPEKWGLVQFSAEEPGSDSFVPDPTMDARRVLFDLYYQQRDYRREHGAYADSIDALNVDTTGSDGTTYLPSLLVTDNGYEAWVYVTMDGTDTRVQIRQDAKLTVGES